MSEADPGDMAAVQPPATAGEALRTAREAAGLSLAEVAQRTRIPQRHLDALDTGDYSALPSSTYAVGFARAYARAVHGDEVGIAALVRREVDRSGPRAREYQPYDLPDPARVPSRGLAIAAAGAALAILILLGLWYEGVFRRSSTAAPPIAATAAAPSQPRAKPAPAPAASGGQVTLTAQDTVWLRVYDADNKTLYLGTMKPGDRFDVPPAAKDPMINVGRPDKLTVTLNGSAVAALDSGERAIKDVKVSAAAIAARAAAAPTSSNTSAPDASNTTAIGNSTH